jgi:FAD/FMN-containing dehydrogenase
MSSVTRVEEGEAVMGADVVFVLQYGLTVDTLIQVDMVLPSGKLVTANQKSYPDLFAAIKGGGNQFGVIYNFRLATNPQTNLIYGGVRIYDASQLDAVLNATAV